MDGTDFRINEPTPFSTSWYSFKINQAGLRYEIGIGIYSDEINWISGPHKPGVKTDLMIFRSDLKNRLESDEFVIADEIYKDRNCIRKSFLAGSHKRKAERILSRHETLNGRLKRFGVLSQQFRHNLDKHSICFFAVANLTQIIIHYEEPLFHTST